MFADITTNVPATNNVPAARANPDLATRKRAAILRLNQYFTIDRDQVKECSTIHLKERMVSIGETDNLKIDIFCSVNATDPLPEFIAFHFIYIGDDWRFLHYSPFAVNYDGAKRDYGSLEVTGDVLPDERVREQMIADITPDDFCAMARAKIVRFNLGTMINAAFTPQTRLKWQALADYFDVIKIERTP